MFFSERNEYNIILRRMKKEHINKDFSLRNNSLKVIAVASGKGGVGKSTMTALLAHALRDLGHNVGVLDADIYGPSMHIMLPSDQPIKSETSGLKPVVSSGIYVMSLGFFKQGERASIVRAPIANATILQFLFEVDWSGIDTLLIDFPPGTGDIHLTLMQNIPITKAILVTTPQAVSVSDVKKSIEMFQKMQIDILGIVENMSFFQDSLTGEKLHLFGEGGGSALSKEFSIPLLEKIPIDPTISMSMDMGRSFFASGGSGACKEKILEIAIEISDQISDHLPLKNSFTEIKEVDSYHIAVDNRVYRYADIQRKCPCARCFDRTYLTSLVDSEDIDEYVTVDAVEKVGRYGLRFHFRSGCKQGIYTCDYLKTLFS